MSSVSLLVVSALCGCFALSCFSSGGSCAEYEVPTGTDLTTPTMSFKTDIKPILTVSCSFSSCHGTTASTNNGLYVGSGDASTSTVISGLLVDSPTMPTMPFVTPGDPSKSFLMHKMDGDQCAFDSSCTNGTCGVSMPQASPLLDVATRDKVRRWIAQGAKDN